MSLRQKEPTNKISVPINTSKAPINTLRVHNRVAAVMAHIPWYTVRCQARLARDAGISEAALSRFLSGQSSPSYALADSIIRALERRLGIILPPRELLSLDGNYPTPSVCTLVGCRGCTPPAVYETEEFSKVRPGQFSGAWPVSQKKEAA